jgi:catechol 2,3-dioxygenase-like lactoylglutathione lyase family enzyme
VTGNAFNHVGIVVADMEEARGRFAAALKMTFTDVVDVSVEGWQEVGHELGRQQLRVCYSIDGPPHYELIEQTGDGLFGPGELGRIHHIGYAEPDLETRLEELQRAGIAPEVLRRQASDGNRLYTLFTQPSGLFGARIELVFSGKPSFLDKHGPAAH